MKNGTQNNEWGLSQRIDLTGVEISITLIWAR